MLKCELCGKPAEETHHIEYQKDADETDHIGHIHKNHASNLVPLCKECHKKETYNKINIIGKVETSAGVILKVENNEPLGRSGTKKIIR